MYNVIMVKLLRSMSHEKQVFVAIHVMHQLDILLLTEDKLWFQPKFSHRITQESSTLTYTTSTLSWLYNDPLYIIFFTLRNRYL